MPQVNIKVLAKMKDENTGKIMTDCANLCAKLYAFKTQVTMKRNGPKL